MTEADHTTTGNGPAIKSFLQQRFQIVPGVTRGNLRDLLRRALRDDRTAAHATVGTEVENPIGSGSDVSGHAVAANQGQFIDSADATDATPPEPTNEKRARLLDRLRSYDDAS